MRSDWSKAASGRKQPAYKQSREHIRLIEEEGFQLKTFPLIHSSELQDKNGVGPSKIKYFERQLYDKVLIEEIDGWYAADNISNYKLAEEISNPEYFSEGTSKKISVNIYERIAIAREKCIEQYGYKCSVCGFDFEKMYGSIGRNYIHVHHIIPLSEIKAEYKLNPITDLRPVCPNCHAILHKKQPSLTIEKLKDLIKPK